ncbi:MAG: 30S ribosomal protein S16 [Armatimonadota bacterium]
MPTRIRLKRTGGTNQPHFRVVIMDQRQPRDGDAVEEIGYYNPKTTPITLEVDGQRALYWLNTGAQPTNTVRSLFKKRGIMEAFQNGVAPEDYEPPEEPVIAQEPAAETDEEPVIVGAGADESEDEPEAAADDGQADAE